jgi:DNA-binding NarL/FixJ family response regulator
MMQLNGILIAEDIEFQRKYLKETIQELFPSYLPLEEAENGEQAVKKGIHSHPLLIVMDIQLPMLNGIAAAKKIWECNPLTRILFWSQFMDEAYLRELQKIVPAETVYGYLLKNTSAMNLRQALTALLVEEQCWIDRGIRGVKVRAEDTHTGLTDAEYEVLIDISLGLTDKAISRRRYLSERGVQNRLHSLYEKLDVDLNKMSIKNGGSVYNPRSRAVALAVHRGLLNMDILGREEIELDHWMKTEGALNLEDPPI